MSRLKMADRPRGTLFCLPFAGGSSYSYRDLQRHADDVRFVVLELPGRGRRFSEPLLTTLLDMSDDLFQQIRDRLDGAYAVYGHSLGAGIGYLLIKRIIREQCPLPQRFFVSGREAPSLPVKQKGRHLLPRAQFIEVLKRFEGTVPEVLENQEMMDLFEPVLRADFQALDTYAYEKTEPFDVPITVMRGSEESVSRDDVLKWQDETIRKIDFLEFSGGHFFIFSHAEEIGRILSRGVRMPADTAA
jgi:surfactin synthase thioesterase subunit